MVLGCDENALLRYVLSVSTEDEAAEVREHLAECSSCVAYLSSFEGEELPGRAERSTAVDELLARAPEQWLEVFAVDRARYATLAAVQALIQACETALDQNVHHAETLSMILVASADALQAGFASRTLQALAWTRRATALLRLGRLPEARDAVATAEDRTKEIPAADYERALIAFTAADVLRELGRTDEALRQIRDAAAVFLRYKDLRRHASAREMEAAVLFRRGDYDGAATLFCSLLNGNPPDAATRGRLAANAAHAFVKLGNHRLALPLFETAERIFRARGNHAYVARIAWGTARTMRCLGDEDAAIAALRDVLRQFEQLHAAAEWVRVGIELVEWLLPTNAFREVQVLCAAVYERAVAAGMQLEALEAVSYLRQAAISETLTADRAQYVRLFLETLPAAPGAEFRPPA